MKGCSTPQLRYGYTNKYLEIKDLSDTTLKLEHQLFVGGKKKWSVKAFVPEVQPATGV